MKKISLLFLLMVFSIVGFTQVKSKQDSITLIANIDSAIKRFRRDSSKMIFKIELKMEGDQKKNNLLVNLEFKNISNEAIKLLDLFDDLSINFFMVVIFEDGRLIRPFGGAFVDFGPNNVFKYINIEKQQSYVKTVNLTEIIKNTYHLVLPKGLYKVEMSYINNYGKDCIKGRFNSETLTLKVVE